MEVTFDPAKDAINIAKHGLSLAEASRLDWQTALVWPDVRQDYGEPRQAALAVMENRVYFVAFVDCADGRRIISLRKANRREVMHYAGND